MGIADTHEPPPIPNHRPGVWSLVMEDVRRDYLGHPLRGGWHIPVVLDDMAARDREGQHKYGTPLQVFNGRNFLVDAYQEMLDATVYMRGALVEEETRDDQSQLDALRTLYAQTLALAIAIRGRI